MARAQKASDEVIISSLLAHGTIRAAAAAVGVSERTIYTRMNEGEFQALYRSSKADLLRESMLRLSGKMQAAIDTTAEIMENPENNPAIRLQAAQTILNNAGRYAQRLQEEENSVVAQIESNTFKLW